MCDQIGLTVRSHSTAECRPNHTTRKSWESYSLPLARRLARRLQCNSDEFASAMVAGKHKQHQQSIFTFQPAGTKKAEQTAIRS